MPLRDLLMATRATASQHSRAVGGYVRELRQQARLTLRELSTATGIHLSQLSNLEIGRRNVSVDDLMVLGPALGVAPARLLTGASLWA